MTIDRNHPPYRAWKRLYARRVFVPWYRQQAEIRRRRDRATSFKGGIA